MDIFIEGELQDGTYNVNFSSFNTSRIRHQIIQFVQSVQYQAMGTRETLQFDTAIVLSLIISIAINSIVFLSEFFNEFNGSEHI